MAKRILYGVLNWGLGHASRSTVIIQALLESGFEPILASDGIALQYLRREFPKLQLRELPAYNVSYSRSNNQWPALIRSLPKIASTAKKENDLLNLWVEEDQIEGIISDNRLGFYHSELPSVYLSHQLRPQAGPFTALAQNLHARFYRKYDQIWVPDTPISTLSGKLSRSRSKKVQYIGPLSALKARASRADKVLVVLSGPEPQRSILEEKILSEASMVEEELVIVRGTEKPCEARNQSQFKLYDLLGPQDLSRLMAQSKLVISRSGYSSVMDYYHLGKKALLIPTPGQSEQVYLAKHLKEQGYYYSVEQKDLQLPSDIAKALAYPEPEGQASSLPNDLFNLF